MTANKYVRDHLIIFLHFQVIFKLIFGSFLSIWQRNKQKVAKNGIQNDVKNVYRERSGKENDGKMHFSHQAQRQNGEKWSKNGSLLVKARLGFHFFKNYHFHIHFFFDSEFHFWIKCIENETKNEVKNGSKRPTVNDPIGLLWVDRYQGWSSRNQGEIFRCRSRDVWCRDSFQDCRGGEVHQKRRR